MKNIKIIVTGVKKESYLYICGETQMWIGPARFLYVFTGEKKNAEND